MTEQNQNGTAEVQEESAKGKEAIYIKLGEYVKDKTGKRIGKTGGRELFDMVVDEIFALATRDGTVRLNGGFGSFHVREYQEGTRRLPSGVEVSFGERKKLRYEEGVVVKALVENGGDLSKAYLIRGSRSEEETAAPDMTVKPAVAAATVAKATAKSIAKPRAAKPAADMQIS
jgi:nucleoid DNA-binding protein